MGLLGAYNSTMRWC